MTVIKKPSGACRSGRLVKRKFQLSQSGFRLSIIIIIIIITPKSILVHTGVMHKVKPLDLI